MLKTMADLWSLGRWGGGGVSIRGYSVIAPPIG